VDTGLKSFQGKTQHPILKGFWIAGDMLLFLTLDCKESMIRIELFGFDDEKPLFECELCKYEGYEKWDATIGPRRRFISLFMLNDSVKDVSFSIPD